MLPMKILICALGQAKQDLGTGSLLILKMFRVEPTRTKKKKLFLKDQAVSFRFLLTKHDEKVTFHNTIFRCNEWGYGTGSSGFGDSVQSEFIKSYTGL